MLFDLILIRLRDGLLKSKSKYSISELIIVSLSNGTIDVGFTNSFEPVMTALTSSGIKARVNKRRK